MTYKIMSHVCAYRNNDDAIVSPTQTFLTSDEMRHTTLIPKTISKKITDIGLAVEDKWLYENPSHSCRGDVYVQTNATLSYFQQRQLMDGLTKLGVSCDYATFQPLVIRRSPNEPPTFVIGDTNASYTKPINSPFIRISAKMHTNDKAGSCLRSDPILRSLNHSFNRFGLRSVYADATIYDDVNHTRNCYALLQKERWFRDGSISDDEIRSLVTDSLSSDFNHDGCDVYVSNALYDLHTKGLVGFIPLAYAQIGGSHFDDALTYTKSEIETSAITSQLKRNSLFANGVGRSKDQMCTSSLYRVQTLFPIDSTIYPNAFLSPQPLESGWKQACAVNVIVSSNDIKLFDRFHSHIYDIVSDINEAFGCDESDPLVSGIYSGSKVKSNGMYAESVFLEMKYEYHKHKDSCYDYFVDAMKSYNELSTMHISSPQIQPLLSDIKAATKIRPSFIKSKNMTKTVADKINEIPEIDAGLAYNKDQLSL